MKVDVNAWIEALNQASSAFDSKYVVIVNQDDYWPFAAALILNDKVRVQASSFVQPGNAYLVPEREAAVFE